jgi:hypothetical protein
MCCLESYKIVFRFSACDNTSTITFTYSVAKLQALFVGQMFRSPLITIREQNLLADYAN